MAEVSNTGRWGAEDRLGTLNLVTPEVRREAAREVRDGVSVSMSLDLMGETEPDAGLRLERNVIATGSESGWTLESIAIDYHGTAYSHLDGLAHALYRDRLYNGVTRADIGDSSGSGTLGIETMREGIVTRGVLVDLPRLRGVPYLDPESFVTAEDLEEWERATGVRVRSGDVLLIRTGRWARDVAEGPRPLGQGAAGPHPSLARWLKERGVAMLGGDNTNERYPTIVPSLSPVHLLTLVAMGMPLLDNLDLEEVAREAAARGRSTFLFVAAPLPLVGGIGSPLNPLAVS